MQIAKCLLSHLNKFAFALTKTIADFFSKIFFRIVNFVLMLNRRTFSTGLISFVTDKCLFPWISVA